MAPGPSPTKYGKVPTQEPEAGTMRSRMMKKKNDEQDMTGLSEREIAKKKWVNRLNWIWRKMEAAFWVGLACLMIYWTNFFRVIWESPFVNRTYLHLAFACLAFNISMLAYLSLWCHAVKGVDEPWEKENKKAVPVMAVVGCLTAVLFFFAFWRVWGFLTIVIQVVFFFGYINAAHFLPSGTIGTVMMFVIFFGAFFTSEMIPHEGLAHYTPRPGHEVPDY